MTTKEAPRASYDPMDAHDWKKVDAIVTIYQAAFDDFAGPREFRHGCNYDTYHRAGVIGLWNAAYAAGAASTVNSLSETVKWVSVTERLPAPVTDEQDEGREVLIVVQKFDGGRYVTCEYVSGLLEMVEHCKAEDETCAYTHWMPLPEAPK